MCPRNLVYEQSDAEDNEALCTLNQSADCADSAPHTNSAII